MTTDYARIERAIRFLEENAARQPTHQQFIFQNGLADV